jgi:hypothetical protein
MTAPVPCPPGSVVIDADCLIRLLAAGITVMDFAPSTDAPHKSELASAIRRAEDALRAARPPRQEESR